MIAPLTAQEERKNLPTYVSTQCSFNAYRWTCVVCNSICSISRVAAYSGTEGGYCECGRAYMFSLGPLWERLEDKTYRREKSIARYKLNSAHWSSELSDDLHSYVALGIYAK